MHFFRFSHTLIVITEKQKIASYRWKSFNSVATTMFNYRFALVAKILTSKEIIKTRKITIFAIFGIGAKNLFSWNSWTWGWKNERDRTNAKQYLWVCSKRKTYQNGVIVHVWRKQRLYFGLKLAKITNFRQRAKICHSEIESEKFKLCEKTQACVMEDTKGYQQTYWASRMQEMGT